MINLSPAEAGDWSGGQDSIVVNSQCVLVHLCVYLYVCVCTCTYVYVCVRVCVRLCVCALVCVVMCVSVPEKT